MSSESASASTSSSSLYCSEDAADLVSQETDKWISHHPLYHSPFDETTLAELIDSEPRFMPEPDYLRRCRDLSIDVTARQDSIKWILKVHAFYRFSPLTAFLSVNYFDRFLSHSLPVKNLNNKSSSVFIIFFPPRRCQIFPRNFFNVLNPFFV